MRENIKLESYTHLYPCINLVTFTVTDYKGNEKIYHKLYRGNEIFWYNSKMKKVSSFREKKLNQLENKIKPKFNSN